MNESSYESNRLPESKCTKVVTLEDVRIPPASVGYIAWATSLVGEEEGIFEPYKSNPTSRALCPGVVKMHSLADKRKSMFIVQYINVEQEAIEIETGRTLGGIQPCTVHPYPLMVAEIFFLNSWGYRETKTRSYFPRV